MCIKLDHVLWKAQKKFNSGLVPRPM